MDIPFPWPEDKLMQPFKFTSVPPTLYFSVFQPCIMASYKSERNTNLANY